MAEIAVAAKAAAYIHPSSEGSPLLSVVRRAIDHTAAKMRLRACFMPQVSGNAASWESRFHGPLVLVLNQHRLQSAAKRRQRALPR